MTTIGYLRSEHDWLQASDAIDYNDLAALVAALECLKKDAQQKRSLKKATRAVMAPDRRSVQVALTKGYEGRPAAVRLLRDLLPQPRSSSLNTGQSRSEVMIMREHLQPYLLDEANFADYTASVGFLSSCLLLSTLNVYNIHHPGYLLHIHR